MVESYSCALLPNNLLIHGRLFVTPRFVCFGSWGTTRLVLPMESIDFVERANTMVRLYSRSLPNKYHLTLTNTHELVYEQETYSSLVIPPHTQNKHSG